MRRRVLIVGNGTIGRALHRLPLLATEPRDRLLVPARAIEQHAAEIRTFAADAELSVCLAHGASVQGLQIAGRYASKTRYNSLLASRVTPIEQMAEIVKRGSSGLRIALISSTVIDASPRHERSLATMQSGCEKAFFSAFGRHHATAIRVGTVLEDGAQFPRFVTGLGHTRLIKRLRARPDFAIRTCTFPTLAQVVASSFLAGVGGVAYATDGKIELNQYLDQRLNEERALFVGRSLFLATFGLLGVPAEFFTSDGIRTAHTA